VAATGHHGGVQIPDAYLPRRASGGRLTMGLRPLAEGAWLEVDADRGVELAMKAELLDSAFATCVAVLPGSEAAGRELLGAVVDDLTRHHADLELDLAAFEVHASSAVAADHGVVAASRLVQEDLCLLDASGVLVAACVCFPSRWNLREKIGQTLDTIH